MRFSKYVVSGTFLIISLPVFAQQPSSLDLELQQEGIVDSNFRYTNSPKTAQLYRDITKTLNQSTPMNMGDGVMMIQALRMAGIEVYQYSVPISSDHLTQKEISVIKKEQYPMLKSSFCFSVNKHTHYKANNQKVKFLYLDENRKTFMDIDIQASDCK